MVKLREAAMRRAAALGISPDEYARFIAAIFGVASLTALPGQDKDSQASPAPAGPSSSTTVAANQLESEFAEFVGDGITRLSAPARSGSILARLDHGGESDGQ